MNTRELDAAGHAQVWPVATRPASNKPLAVQWAPSPDGTGQLDLNLATLWRIIFEWRWLILGMVALGVAGAAVVTMLTTPLYRAKVVLEINPPTVEVLEGAKAKSGGADDKLFLATQYGLLQSRSLAERVAQDLNLASKEEFVPTDTDRGARQKIATGKLMQSFEVEPVANSRLVEISYTSPNPELSAQIANSFADGFINSNLERRYEASSYARDFLQRQIARVKGELERSERQLVGYAQRQGIINTAGDGEGGDTSSLQGGTLVSLNGALATAQTKRIAAEQRYRQATAASAADVAQGTSGLRAQRAALEADYQEKLTSFKPDYPDMVRLRNRIEALDAAIRKEAGVVSGGRSSTLLADYQAALAEERSLLARVNQLKSSVLGERGRSIEYNILRREVDTNRALYDALLQRYKEIGVAGGIGTNLVSVIDRAEVPGAPYTPNLPFNLLLGFGLGLMLGVATALALEFIDDRIKTPDDVRDKLGMAFLGGIPEVASKSSVMSELSDVTSPVSEAYSSLRTSLQFTTESGAPKTLLVSSTRAAEGKSSTTYALAQNFARLGKSVLLIDADLRKPTFSTGAKRDQGLSKLLTNDGDIDEHLLSTQTDNLWLLPCGPLPPNPAELLSSNRLRVIISSAAQRFDMVIVDGPPVLGLADAPLLSTICSATLFVVESRKTRTRPARDSLNRLRDSGANLIGAVLTKYRHQSQGYGYSYNYEPYRYGEVSSSKEREIRLVAPSAE